MLTMDSDDISNGSQHGLSSQSQYPEFDQMQRFPWLGQDQNQVSGRLADTQSNFHGFLREGLVHHGQVSTYTSERPGAENPVGSLAHSTLGHGVEPRSEVDFLEAFGESNRDDDELSETDSDYRDHRSEVANWMDSVLQLRADQREGGSDGGILEAGRSRGGNESRGKSGRNGRGGRGKGVLRGPRRAAEPTGDIKFRMSKANLAYIDEEYDSALAQLLEVIQINAETHEAWTLLASIFKELGNIDKALLCLVYACHLRPKDVEQWLRCAKFALEETGENKSKHLDTAKICYASAIRANPKDTFQARCGKAAVLRAAGNVRSAISEYKTLLKLRPHNTTILRLIAEAYVDQDDVEAAKDLYRASITYYRNIKNTNAQEFDWSDVNIYVELYGYLGQYEAGIKELKSLARWLLGRQTESFWDNVTDDDREWDLENDRRTEVSGFDLGRYGLEQYGEGLPLELRVKLGLYRVRIGSHKQGLSHLGWLDPENRCGEDKIVNYQDLFRESADCLREAGLGKDALSFYRAIHAYSEHVDASLYLQMGRCHLALRENTKAEECFQTAIQVDEANIEARIELAKLYESQNEGEQAFIYVSEILSLRKEQNSVPKERRGQFEAEDNTGTFMPPKRQPKSYYKPRRLIDPKEKQRQEVSRAERLQEHFELMRSEESGMRAGQVGASLAWMEAARELIEDFRAYKTFYPWDTYVHFLGYTGSAPDQLLTDTAPLDADVAAMADRLSNKFSAKVDDRAAMQADIPENYRGISFSDWLDIFLQYALCLVKFGRKDEAYDVCNSARDAIVFCHSAEDMFLIHVCHCACALLANDEDACIRVCRYFTKEYQFTTDCYRMFAALTRLCQSPISWYTSGPTQKYMLRQIRTMDFALVNDESRQKFIGGKVSYSAVDESGQIIVNSDLDVALLMVYGHILYSGTSYVYALNYFFRAHALDPENPMINLSVGLAYVHYGLKRQADNRQFHIMQGLSFLFRYYDARRESLNVEERQEAHFNVARTYHLLGLSHLALPFYMKVLHEVKGSAVTREDLVLDAAYNSQTIFAMAGNLEMAKHVADTWLVI